MQQRLSADFNAISSPACRKMIASKRLMKSAWRSIRLAPFSEEPVDCVVWVKNSQLMPNDYNPNNVAPPKKNC